MILLILDHGKIKCSMTKRVEGEAKELKLRRILREGAWQSKCLQEKTK